VFHKAEGRHLAINVETSQFRCWHASCGVRGNKMVTFEMALLGTDDRNQAMQSVLACL
jgi:hypothetical protein